MEVGGGGEGEGEGPHKDKEKNAHQIKAFQSIFLPGYRFVFPFLCTVFILNFMAKKTILRTGLPGENRAISHYPSHPLHIYVAV